MTLSVIPLTGLPLVQAGDDLSEIIGAGLARAGIVLRQDDVVVVAQKVVSKAEDRLVDPDEVLVTAAAEALAVRSRKPAAVAALILAEAATVMRVVPNVVVVRNRHGQVLANAGIDSSNVADGKLLLWPADPDGSARILRTKLGGRAAVIISDSLGRAWRMGTIGTAIGCAGLRPLRDRCGETDLFGRELRATRIGVADEIAAAASLVMGEGAEGLPVVVVRGACFEPDDAVGIAPLLRPVSEDLFL